MNSFKMRLYRFMQGRRGTDELVMASYFTGLALWVLNLFLRSSILGLISTALWIWGIFRMLSRNIAAREKENSWFLGWFTPLRTKIKNAKVRFKNRHVYLYYRCPQCKAWLKLPRHIGEKTVTCSACGATFKKKA